MIPLHKIPPEKKKITSRITGRNGNIYLDNRVLGTTTTANWEFDASRFTAQLSHINDTMRAWTFDTAQTIEWTTEFTDIVRRHNETWRPVVGRNVFNVDE